MNAKPLFTEDRADIVAYFCSECRYVKTTKEAAEKCCQPNVCQCGADLTQTWPTSCDDCRESKRIANLKIALAEATRVQVPSHSWVYSPDATENEGYFEFNALAEVFDDEEMPLFVYDCTRQDWQGLNAEQLVESEFEGNWYEDAVDDVVGLEELDNFLKAWNKKQTAHQFEANEKQIIVLDETKFDAWLAESNLEGNTDGFVC